MEHADAWVYSFREPDDGQQRFRVELEFVQCLANPEYIHYLAQNKYFDDPAFVNYLTYLQYWRKPPYCTYIMYPHCLFFLELLQEPDFRAAMAHPHHKEFVHRQQFYFWKHHRAQRLRLLQQQRLAGIGPSAPEPPPLPPKPPQAPSTAPPSALLSSEARRGGAAEGGPKSRPSAATPVAPKASQLKAKPPSEEKIRKRKA